MHRYIAEEPEHRHMASRCLDAHSDFGLSEDGPDAETVGDWTRAGRRRKIGVKNERKMECKLPTHLHCGNAG